MKTRTKTVWALMDKRGRIYGAYLPILYRTRHLAKGMAASCDKPVKVTLTWRVP